MAENFQLRICASENQISKTLSHEEFFATVTVSELVIIFLLDIEVNLSPFVVYFFFISVLFLLSGKIIKGSIFDKGVVEYIFINGQLIMIQK